MSACPWCREKLPAVKAPDICPHCGKALLDASGARLRPIDLDFETILSEADAASHTWLVRGAIWAAVLGAISLFPVPVVSAGAMLVLIVSQLFWGRFLIARRYVRHFSAVRRFTTRWLSRLTVVTLLMPLYGTVMLWPFGIVTGPALFTGINWLIRAYFRYHFLREHRRQGVNLLEKVFLVVLAFAFLAMLCLFALFWSLLVSVLFPAGK